MDSQIRGDIHRRCDGGDESAMGKNRDFHRATVRGDQESDRRVGGSLLGSACRVLDENKKKSAVPTWTHGLLESHERKILAQCNSSLIPNVNWS